jgi:hypothetical protein
MRILLKCPTRSRPERVRKTLSVYRRFANHPELIGVAVSCDVDDDSMKETSELQRVLSGFAWNRIYYGTNRTKIQACNANMNEIDYEWDIVVLVSDDMVPQIRGYDDVIRNEFLAGFPDTNGILWANDGCQGDRLNTLCIFGREFYKRQGFIYNPEYKSLFCDTELTDQCRSQYKNICRYIPYCIIRHEHPGTGFRQTMDKLYEINQKYWNEDMYTYIRRKTYTLDWSVLIATITGREGSLKGLLSRIRERVSRIAPHLRVEYVTYYDNREVSIGAKRQWLLERATGKYMSFIDDDDDITDAYIEDLVETIRGNYHVMRLRGQISPYTFTHSVENKLNDKMARNDEFIRPPNHLNPMLTDVAKIISFKDAVRGEDLEWTIRLARAGFLTHEYRSSKERIHYIYNMGDRKVDGGSLDYQSKTTYEDMLKMLWVPGNASGSPQPQKPKDGIPSLRLGPNGFVSR